MANTIINSSIITRETLRILKNNLSFLAHVNRQYDDKFGQAGAKIGDTLNIRLPNTFTVRTGAVCAPVDIVETSVPLTVATQIGIDFEFPDVDLVLQLDDFSTRYIQPAAVKLADALDAATIALAVAGTSALVGTSPNVPSSSATYLAANAALTNAKAPRGSDNRTVIFSPAAQAATVEANKDQFNHQNAIGEQYLTGEMARAFGFTFDVDQNATTTLAFTKDAYTLVTADMELPNNMDMASRARSDGISIRFIRGYDITNDKRICRLDLLYGFAVIRPTQALKVFQV